MLSNNEVMTATEFHEGECFKTVGPRGGVKVSQVIWRRNGRTQTWKTRPDDFRIPVKWGLRGYDSITPANADRFHTNATCPLNHSINQ